MAQKILVIVLMMAVLQSCFFVMPVPHKVSRVSAEGRSGLSERMCKKMVKKSMTLKSIILAVGTPKHIDLEKRTAIYHAPTILTTHTDFLVWFFIPMGFLPGPSVDNYRDMYYEFKCDEEWKIQGIRLYRIDRLQSVEASFMNDYDDLLNDYFVDLQIQNTRDPLWPPIANERPDWHKPMKSFGQKQSGSVKKGRQKK